MSNLLRKFKRFIRKQLGINQLIENQNQIINILNSHTRKNDEILKASIFNNTIYDSTWLKYKSFSPCGWAVDYAFLYTLYRVLNDTKPQKILEFGLGQSSKMIHQYADFFKNIDAITYEHDQTWINFFMNHFDGNYKINTKLIELKEIDYNTNITLSYKDIESEFKNQKFNLIIVDAPFGSESYSRSQILALLPTCLEETFCIIIDDFDRIGEKETVNEINNILDAHNLSYYSASYSGIKSHIIICSEDLNFLTSL